MDTVPLSPPLILSGAAGTNFISAGMSPDECTPRWALEHPEVLESLQRGYLNAGAQVISAPTFLAHAAALSRYGLEDKVEEYNRALVTLTRQTADGKAAVAAELAPIGLKLPPFGHTSFDELVDIYTRQARACHEAGADLFIVETVMAMPEARAAVLAVKSVCDKPVWVTFTCDEEGRTASGTDVLSALIVMQGMGVAAFGINCCTLETTVEQLERLYPYAHIPLIAKPSAGLPETTNGVTVYPTSPADFAQGAAALAQSGAVIFGGCCGTTQEHIAALKAAVEQVDFAAILPPELDSDLIPCASEREARFITADVDIGDALECTPDLLEDILDAEDGGDGALKIAIYSQDDLDIFAENQYAIEDALCICTDVPELLEGALRTYHGRALWDGTCDLPDLFLQEMSVKYGLVVL